MKNSSPEPKNKDSIPDTLPENKNSVNVIAEAEEIIDSAPGKTASEPLPNIRPATPAADTAGAKPKTGKGSRGPYKKTKERVTAPPVEPMPQTVPVDKIPVEAVARSVNQAFETVLLVTLGSESELTPEERTALDGGLSNYMRIKNYDIPPGAALVLCYGAVVAGKIQKPKPKERISAIWTAIKQKFGRKKKDYEINQE